MASRWRCPPERLATEFPEHRSIAIRQFPDEFIRQGQLAGLHHLSEIESGMGEGEVVEDAPIEELRVLWNEHHLPTQAVEAEVATAEGAVVNRSLLWWVDTGDQFADAALAANPTGRSGRWSHRRESQG